MTPRTFSATALALALLGAAPAAHAICLLPQGTVKIDSQILIDGVARPGVHVKVTSSLVSAAEGAMGFDYSADLDTHTDAQGRIRGQWHVCGPLLLRRSS